MSEQNPYQPPSVAVEDAEAQQAQGNFVPQGRAVGADRGVGWLTSGFKMALAQFGPWVVIVILLFVISFVLGMLPFISIIINVLLPVFVGGVMIGARRQAEGGAIEIADLFACFKEKFGPLMIVGLLALVLGIVLAMVLIAPIVGFSVFSAMASGNERALLGGLGAMLFLAIPLMFLVGAIVAACWWLAPALVVFHDVAPVEAMKRSFMASLKNWAPVLVYGVLATIVAMIGAIPFGLGLLLVAPALMAATYLAYRDIFIEA